MCVYLLQNDLVKEGIDELQELTEKRKKREKHVVSIFLPYEPQNEGKIIWSP